MRRHAIWCLVAAWLITMAPLMVLAQGEAGDTQAKKPSFWVENDSINLGEVMAGDDVIATFVFHNDGDVPVTILKAKPS